MPKSIQSASQATETSKAQKGGTAGKKGKGAAFTLIAFLSVVLIIAVVLGGVFYFVIRNNVNGLGERYRSNIQGIPILKLALPPVEDPLDPKYLTDKEIRQKYDEFRKANRDLVLQLEEARKQIADLQKAKDENASIKAEGEKVKSEAEAMKLAAEERQKQLDEYKRQVDLLVANGDKEGFKKFFESVDPEVAKQIYTDVMKQQKLDEDAKKFAQIYESMEADAAAGIMEKLGSGQLDMIAQMLHSMKKQSSSAILAAMDPAFAAKVTQKLEDLFKNPDIVTEAANQTPSPTEQ